MIDHTRPILIVLLIAASLGIAACGGTSFKTEERQTFKDASRTATVEAQVPEGIEEITLDLGLEVRKGTVAFTVRDPERWTVFDVSSRLRRYGWQVPAYTMPADAEDVAVLRVVVREGFSADLRREIGRQKRKATRQST